jgi:asparagine synthase (glutamine-hydrolysing)
MSNEDGSLWIVFNGEIYNHDELRGDRRFRTRSDTEVLLRLYEEQGPACLDRLVGMFALAVFDERDGSIFLARDRLGKKPLFYRQDGDRLVFASELKALPRSSSRVDREALELYLAYLYIPAPHSILEGVRKLPPAHWALWRDGKLRVERYWRPQPRPAKDVRALVEDSVRLRLVSDVPVACFLSGGIDSTIVASLAAARSRDLLTISVGFDDARYNELPFARRVARKLGTRHEEIIVRPDAAALLPTLAETFDEPFGDSSALPTYLLCREAARHVKVALSGEGGDECFAGYRRHLAMARLPLARKTPAVFARLAARLFPSSRAARWISMARSPDAEIYRMLVTFLGEDERRKLGAGKFDVRPFIEAPFAEFPGDPLNAAGRTDLLTYLPGDLLVKIDTASMAHSIEVRAPFLDHRLVDAALAVPNKVRGMTTKHYLRELFRDLIPPALRRRKKQGFSIPLKSWLKRDLRPAVQDLLLAPHPRLETLLDPSAVRALCASRTDVSQVLWALMMLELWLRK